MDKTIKLWNTTDGTLIRTLLGHKSVIFMSLDLLNNRQILVSGSFDKTVKFWNWTTNACLKTFYFSFEISALKNIKSKFFEM